ncbi:ATP synthase F1 subunit epsilon [Candidatus Sulcia muelleri]|uniref:ATP synthase F1 subunit epsilon n=1 Tax=Candidatus Karelsulcia muelleri TaxID=336810 RepID=UPI000BDCCCAA|nr:ATP synthase F1 subunit epsilon [Candidatus Karelsulcia muelleri]NHU72406.1 ATP synthase F1 subunit epsilon [Candidatus Karelsulcia muelleri]
MKILILKKEKKILEIEGFAVFFSTEKGQLELLNNHCSLISMISSGIIKIYSNFLLENEFFLEKEIKILWNQNKNTTILKIKINSGFLKLKNNKIIFLV